ncbi:solute carrier family 35 member E4 isoform X1 [Electrophorus electricus]|uniref:solute carrier family 35 member E4 isoform X1 n=2 Tax=Electrophorus electricus TaxID=8005 RepID=UPI0015CFAA59|nr:solute carrier family 35 member E4 isoform X1 [Electrophorus electricus]XP_035391817.1 solute carrier family 35 member E4 isoform X1 [Electrophorus electricus]
MYFPCRREDETNMIGPDGPSKREPSRAAGTRRSSPGEILHLLSAVVVWLVTGTTISSLNKWIFAVYNFRYPLLLSALHMLTAVVVDYGLVKYWVARRTRTDGPDLTRSVRRKVLLLSLTFCASIALGNVGLSYVQLSFAQMIYTTTPIFTLAISSLVLGKQHHVLKYTAMMPICLGASFSILGEVQFDQTGCFCVLAATLLRGVKSIQQSILLQEEKIPSVFLLYLMAVPSFLILAVAALALENWAGLQALQHYDRRLWGFILLSCLGSVLYNLASCCVISLTSAVTLHILGNLSMVGNLLLSQMLFGSQLSALSCAGAALTLSGMIIYQNSELIAGYLDARRARGPAGTRRDMENDDGEQRQEPEPCSESTSGPSRESLELSVVSSLEVSTEVCHYMDPSPELYYDVESYLEQSSEPYHDRQPSLESVPELSLELSPETVLHRRTEKHTHEKMD